MLVCALLGACDQPGATSPAPDDAFGRFLMTKQSMQQWKLPGKLKEISGLALSDDGRLFAVADESAIVYELDYARGRIVKSFALGKPTVRGDFEGIAIAGERIYLTTSDGVIFSAREGDDGSRVSYETYETGIGEHCEIEGLAVLDENLLLLCKTVRSNDLIDGLSIFVWAIESAMLRNSDLIALPESEILDILDSDSLSPSGLAVDGATGHLLIVAAQQRALLAVTADGTLVQAKRMPLAERHRQAEGIEVTRASELLISDEGGGDKARIAVYRTAETGD